MTRDGERTIVEGLVLGAVSGGIFAVANVLAAVARGEVWRWPLREYAAVLLGAPALGAVEPGTAVLIGSLVLLVLGACYGLLFALFSHMLTDRARRRTGGEAVLGVAYGVWLWFVNVQIVSRLLFPWFLEEPQQLLVAIYALAYGLPLGLMYARSERRAQLIARLRLG